ncbi:MAG: A/G-specific adenine glycosylase [Legionellales bacterium]|nr:A/G-specific adenine glycosylase [Legionellales bacterium]
MPGSLSPALFQQAVLAWYDDYGRKNLPWQQNLTAYRVWVSEIMLQQTQVTTVIPYFENFILVFPTVEALALAESDEVMHLWTGLGYYSRARNLHKAAKMIVSQFGSQLPDSTELLMTLPGIGRSTAGAIVSTAFNQRATILDGNVKRVLSRYAGISDWTGSKKAETQLWELAEFYTPAVNCRPYTQVMMDLGATICTRTKPRCEACPLQVSCAAFASGNPLNFPGKKPKKTIPVRKGHLLLLQLATGAIFLEKRPPVGIWGGLWSLPAYEGNLENLTAECQHRYGLVIEKMCFLDSLRHTFSHFHYDITPIHATVVHSEQAIYESSEHIWYDLESPPRVGLPRPVKTLLMGIN